MSQLHVFSGLRRDLATAIDNQFFTKIETDRVTVKCLPPRSCSNSPQKQPFHDGSSRLDTPSPLLFHHSVLNVHHITATATVHREQQQSPFQSNGPSPVRIHSIHCSPDRNLQNGSGITMERNANTISMEVSDPMASQCSFRSVKRTGSQQSIHILNDPKPSFNPLPMAQPMDSVPFDSNEFDSGPRDTFCSQNSLGLNALNLHSPFSSQRMDPLHRQQSGSNTFSLSFSLRYPFWC